MKRSENIVDKLELHALSGTGLQDTINNPDLKIRLAVLCDVLIRLSNHNPSTFYPRGTLKLCTALL